MRRTLATAALILTAAALTGCTVTRDDATPEPTEGVTITPTAEPAPETTEPEAEPESDDRTEVPWADYDADLQPRIDALTAAGDCAGLQTEFDTADANNDATMSRTGHNNFQLMTYIDEAMRQAECY